VYDEIDDMNSSEDLKQTLLAEKDRLELEPDLDR
jgi:hypothetical protein